MKKYITSAVLILISAIILGGMALKYGYDVKFEYSMSSEALANFKVELTNNTE